MSKKAIIVYLTLVTLIMIVTVGGPRYHFISIRDTFSDYTLSNDSGTSYEAVEEPVEIGDEGDKCDIFTGEWIPNPDAPYYTNLTCFAIHDHQNCMKYGRPDSEFMRWRWKPDGCELPVLDPSVFLDVVRGKSIAFVGDSVARNQMQSMICLLSKILYPEDVSEKKNDENKRYVYKDYNFTISMFWSPYLVKAEVKDFTRPFKLFLDEFDENWTTKIIDYDYVIISAGHWFNRPTYFHEKGKLVGCLYCPQSDNLTYLTSYYSYQRAFRTAFKAINSIESFKGVTFFRTFSPAHFEGGSWDNGGKCSRTRPFKRNETALDEYTEKNYKIQLEEFQIAKREGRRKDGRRFKLFDTTKPMWLRPDGHPSQYGHWPQQKVVLAEDCVHWCLPGPIDSWNDFLLELLKREQEIAGQ